MAGPPACPSGNTKPLTTNSRLRVAGKGSISVTFAGGGPCMAAGLSEQEFTITGGTGAFSGASGSGTLQWPATGSAGPIETWAGTLDVPRHAFDLAAPRLSGVAPRTVRTQTGAASARVAFIVTATDGVDGAVPASCRPASGSLFYVGRTTVRCKATDSSGNTAKAVFTVTVKR